MTWETRKRRLSRLATFLAVLLAVLLAVVGSSLPTGTPAAAEPSGVARTSGIPLNVRSGPSAADDRVGHIANDAPVDATCQTPGQRIRGTVATSSAWLRLRRGGFVSAAYVTGAGNTLPPCATGRIGTASVTAVARTGGSPLSARTGPGTSYSRIHGIADGTRLTLSCQRTGQPIRGTVRTTAAWVRLTDGSYVSYAYVATSGAPHIPTCMGGQRLDPTTFINRVAGPARQSYQQYRVPASVTIAQAILESGWGASTLAAEGNSYFGIKCIGGTGPVATGCVTLRTFECDRAGRCFPTADSFRVYRSVTDSFRDHARLLTRSQRYRPAVRYHRDPDRYAATIHQAGYATDPRYAAKLIQLMRQHRLYRYDR